MSFIPLYVPYFEDTYANAVQEQVLSGWVGPGPRTQEFQEALAKYSGTEHALLTVSGTAALSVCAKALGLGAGDEILVPAYGVFSTINAFASFGLKPRLVDIDRNSGCMSPEELKKRITPETKAVCFVNFSGNTGPDLVQVEAICREKGLPLIEDAACAMGHAFEGRRAGSFGTLGIYSFSVPKIITTGQGGCILTKSDSLRDEGMRFLDQGDLDWRKTNLIHGIGNNLRFNDILSSFGLAQLNDLEARLDRKSEYFGALKGKLDDMLFDVQGPRAPLHYIVFTPDAESLVTALRDQKIGAARQYRTISQNPAYAELADADFPNSDYWTNNAVYLPFGLNLETTDAERIAAAVLEAGFKLDRIEAAR